jgi:hypothetical protein
VSRGCAPYPYNHNLRARDGAFFLPGAAMILHIDIETFSPADLPKVGSWKYAQHPDTRILMVGYALDDDDVKVWECHTRPMPPSYA